MLTLQQLPKKYLPYIVTGLFCAVIAALSIQHGQFVAAGDSFLPELAPSAALSHASSTWDHAAGLGRDNSLARPYLFPIIALDVIFSKVGLPSTFANHFWIYFVVISQGIFALRLFRTLFPNMRTSPAQLFVPFAAIVNPFTTISIHELYTTTLISIAVFPGVIASAIRYCEDRRSSAMVEFLILTAVSATAVNLGISVVESGLLGFVFVAHFSTARSMDQRLSVLQLLSVYLAVVCIWYIPDFHALRSLFSQLMEDQRKYSDDTLRVTAESSYIFNAVRLVGEYLYFNKVGPRPFIAGGTLYLTSPWLIWSTLFLPALAAAALAIRDRSRTKKVVLFLICLVCLFFAKGISAPGGNIFAWLYNHLAFFRAFRDSFNKFEWVVVLCYVFLGAITLDGVIRGLPKFLRLTSLMFSGSIVAVAGYPVLAGQMLWPHSFITIPDDYFTMAAWFNSKPDDGRLLEVPVSPSIFDTYSWGYVGAGILPNLINRPVVARLWDDGAPSTKAINDAMQEFPSVLGDANVAPLLGAFGIRYIVADASVDVKFLGNLHSANMPNPSKGFVLANGKNDVKVYKAQSRLVSPYFYAARQLVEGPKTLRELAYTCRVLGSCREVAVLPPSIAHLLPVRHYALVSFRRNGDGRPLPRHFRVFENPSIIDFPDGQLSSPKPTETISFTDFGNLSTVTPEAAAQAPIIYAGMPPVSYTVSIHRGSPHAEFSSLVQRSRRELCALGYKASEETLHFSTIPIQRHTALLLVVYRSPVPLNVTLTDPEHSDKVFGASLPGTSKSRAFARFFQVEGTSKQLKLTLSAKPSYGSACAMVSRLIIAINTKRIPNLNLFGGDNNFHATPPYMAAHENIMNVANNRVISNPGHGRADSYNDSSRKVASYSDTSSSWSAPEVTGNLAVDSHHVWSSSDGAAGTQNTTVDISNASAAVRAAFGHLLPGAEYVLSFPIHRLTGSARLTILSETQEYLASQTIEDTRGTHYVKIPFRLSGDAVGVTVYLYLNTSSSGRSINVFGTPQLTLVEQAPRVFQIESSERTSNPTIEVQSVGASRFNISVHNAPRQFVLVFNSSYTNNWRLLTPPSVSAKHFAANLYVNGWLITGSGNYALGLHYDGDDYAKIAIICSFGCIFMGFILLPLGPKTIQKLTGKRQL